MIPCFPVPYPDELFYSICARYSDRMMYPTAQAVLHDLFGTTAITATADLPHRLDFLIANLPPGHHVTADQLIDDHSLFPYYTFFLPSERSEDLRTRIRRRNGPGINATSGIVNVGIRRIERLRFCPRCAEEDREKFCEPYWHRLHQVPGVEVCPQHQSWLKPGVVRLWAGAGRQQFVSADRAIPTSSSRVEARHHPYYDVLIHIVRDAAWILSYRGASARPEQIYAAYRVWSAEIGAVDSLGRITAGRILNDFKERYTPEFLRFLHCDLGDDPYRNWLSRSFRSQRQFHHPLYHLMLLDFFKHTIQEFIELALTGPVNPRPNPINWGGQDRAIEAAVRDLAVRLRSADGQPIWITRNRIAKGLGQWKSFYLHIDKLPLTRQALMEVNESPQDFAIRRIDWVANCFIAEGKIPERREFATRARVNVNLQRKDPGIKDYLNKALRKIALALSRIRAQQYQQQRDSRKSIG